MAALLTRILRPFTQWYRDGRRNWRIALGPMDSPGFQFFVRHERFPTEDEMEEIENG